jgi:hypothetical protein
MKDFFLNNSFNLGVDLDEVIVDFIGGYAEYTGHDLNSIKNFNFSYKGKDIIDSLPHEFWENLKPLIKPSDLNFLPSCYITKRKFPQSITENWLEKHGFPCKKVYHVTEQSKLAACKEAKVDFYLDDAIENFQDLNSNGIKTFLMDAQHNKQFDVGDMRVYHIRDFIVKVEKEILKQKK